MEAQLKFYKVMSVSSWLNGSENWILTEKDENRIHATDIIFLYQR
jgi:homoserine dehydrogenase